MHVLWLGTKPTVQEIRRERLDNAHLSRRLGKAHPSKRLGKRTELCRAPALRDWTAAVPRLQRPWQARVTGRVVTSRPLPLWRHQLLHPKKSIQAANLVNPQVAVQGFLAPTWLGCPRWLLRAGPRPTCGRCREHRRPLFNTKAYLSVKPLVFQLLSVSIQAPRC